MSDDAPWWAEIKKALVKKAVEAINVIPPDKVAGLFQGADPRVIDVPFEDVPKKAPPKRRKALPPRSPPPSEEVPLSKEK